jgi:hypothetical protein
MSRHLMARFRHLAAKINWQHGVLLPDTAQDMKYYNDTYVHQIAPGNRNAFPEWHPEAVSTAFIPYGERMHALQVNREPGIIRINTGKTGDQNSWVWSIKAHKGDDLENPDHGEMLNQVDENDPVHGALSEWDWNGSLTGGQEIHKSRDDSNGTDGGYWGYHTTQEGAMRAAENAWNKHIGENSGDVGTYDINDIMKRFDGGEL